MDKALGVTGQLMSLQMVVAPPPAITEDLTVQTNASKTVGNHLSNCKFEHSFVMKFFKLNSKHFGSDPIDITGTMYLDHGCNQVGTLLCCLRKSAGIQHRYLSLQNRWRVCVHECRNITHFQ